MLGKLDVTLMAGVGAAFDIHAGLVTDSPGLDKAVRIAVARPTAQGAPPAVAKVYGQQPGFRLEHGPPGGSPAPVFHRMNHTTIAKFVPE